MPIQRRLPLNAELFANLAPAALSRGHVRLDNLFVNDVGGLSTLPRLREFTQLPIAGSEGPVYLHRWRQNETLIAVTGNGKVFEISGGGVINDVTGPPVQVLRRPTFTETEDQLVIAAGGRMNELAGSRTAVLTTSFNATHVAYIDGYLVANDYPSGRWRYSNNGLYREWPALNLFVAESRPDPIAALLVNRFNELVIAGKETIEIFRTAGSGDTPFYRIETLGRGVTAPYTMIDVDNAVWALNDEYEFAQLTRGGGQVVSQSIGKVLDQIRAPEQVWAAPLHVAGQRFIVLHGPEEQLQGNSYKGFTYVYDYRYRRWFTLSGYDAVKEEPRAFPLHSIARVWGRVFIGSELGKIYEYDQRDTWQAATGFGGQIRQAFRTAPFRAYDVLRGAAEMEICDIWLTLRRETGNRTDAKIMLRANLDDRGWNSWVTRPLEGSSRDPQVRFGAQGQGASFQLEVQVVGDYPVEIVAVLLEVEHLD